MIKDAELRKDDEVDIDQIFGFLPQDSSGEINTPETTAFKVSS